VIEAALSPLAGGRFATAAEMREALESAMKTGAYRIIDDR
jgi:hypothetical protein